MNLFSKTGGLAFSFGSVVTMSLLIQSVSAQSTEPPIDDKRLSIHTLIREDIFSGWRSDNMKRLERGEANIEKLLKSRPGSRADLLAWKGGTKMYRAILAKEAGETKGYEKTLKEARELFSQAKKENIRSGGVHSLIGGSNAMFADRLEKKDQAKAWDQAYESYQFLWKAQGPQIDRMPLHIGGELLAGLAQTSQRTGKTKEVPKYLDLIIKTYDGSSYAKEAKSWKENPALAAKRNITCNSCHSSGRLRATLKRLDAAH